VKPLDQATGILGEHFKNYVVIVQDADVNTFMDVVSSDPYATTGLLIEASKWHEAQMNALNAPADDWDWEEEDEEPEEDDEF
jgi:hypothetical protein